jgi:hypothetical protein
LAFRAESSFDQRSLILVGLLFAMSVAAVLFVAGPMARSHTADYISEVDCQANFAKHEWLRKKGGALHARRDAATTEPLNAIGALSSG